MRETIQQQLACQPCNTCNRGVKCPGKCPQYEKWFGGVWRSLRKLYLGKGV